MQLYNDESNSSEIVAFQLGAHSFRILLKSGTYCIFSTPQVSWEIIEEMNRLGVRGEGLDEFIEELQLLRLARKV